MLKAKRSLLIYLAPGLIFFVVGILTLTRYGVNWDTVNHLPRGQAYLQFFLTGRKDYDNLPKFFDGWQTKGQWYWQKPESLGIDNGTQSINVPARSMYQLDSYDYNSFINNDGSGHPPLSDILSSLFNRVLFAQLRLINDIDSYRVYSIFLASALVVLVFYWVSKSYGKFAGWVASISLALYPLFWAESHFNNEKDIPETVYWSFMLFSVWKGITTRNWKWMILSGVFFGLALGTKFNILFSIFVIMPWLIVYSITKYQKLSFKVFFKDTLWLGIFSFLAIFLGTAIFIGSWPYLWSDPLTRIAGVVKFYKEIGLTQGVDPRFAGPFGITTYPLQWIIYTTTLPMLSVSAIGIVKALKNCFKESNKLSLLFLLWFIVPIARVTWGGASTYGGIRQIMEFIPAMAILAGIGLSGLANWNIFNSKWKRLLLIFIYVLFLIIPIIRTHPNENVYFNSLIGGIKGAKEKNFPYWGFSFGSPYRQLAVWLNTNANPGSNIAYTYDLIPNLPRIWLRDGFNLSNSNRSGFLRKGEYAIGLVYQGTQDRSYYDSYLEQFIKPVYEVKVDGVAIAKIWKNDDAYLKRGVSERVVVNPKLILSKNGLVIDLNETRKLSRLEINYNNRGCSEVTSGYSRISLDGNLWINLPGSIPDDWSVPLLGVQPKNGKFIEPFVGQDARFISLELAPAGNCLTKVNDFKVYYFE